MPTDILQSNFTDLGDIMFPTYAERDKYMHTFSPKNPIMAEGFEDYLPVVQQILSKLPSLPDEVHMTVDEKLIRANWSQRRPGAHVDGYFLKEEQRWGGPPPPIPPRPGGWAHYCNNLPLDRMSIIVASTVAACKAYPGKHYGKPAEDGDLEHIRNQLDSGILLPANRAYLLTPDCVHESLRFTDPTKRQFLRLAFA